jgi:hypothetical protein
MNVKVEELLKQARDATKRGREVDDEVGRIRRMEEDCHKVLKTAEDGDINDARLQLKVAEARVRLDLCTMRRKKLQDPQREARTALEREYRGISGDWNTLVAEKRKETEEKRIQAELEFWEGDERACRRHFQGLAMEEAPIFYRLRRAVHLPQERLEDLERVVNALESLAGHIVRHSKALGWD